MGGMAEHFNSLLNLGVQYAGTEISVGAPVGQASALLPLSTGDRIAKVQGVAAVYPTYRISAEPGGPEIQAGPPEMIGNEQGGATAYGAPGLTFASGHDVASGSHGEVVLGSSLAATWKKRTGDTLQLPVPPKGASPDFVSHTFTVVGVLAKTGQIDTFAYVNDADARMLFHDSLPAAVQKAVNVDNVAQGFAVFAKSGSSLATMDAIAAAINAQVLGVHAQKPSEQVANFKATGTTFTAVALGAALLALVIGGLSVVNTMIMAVGERIREIGLKKALGARTGTILLEYLAEAALIGALGGAVGFLAGLALTSTVDYLGSLSGFDIFLVTPRLTAMAIGFAIALAVLAGIYPAFRAARLDPVTALRSQG